MIDILWSFLIVAAGTFMPLFIFGIIFTILKWRKEKRYFNEAGLLINSYYTWIKIYFKGAREGIRLHNNGIGLEYQVSLQYWYLPCTPACSNYLFALNKVKRLPSLDDSRIKLIFDFFTNSFDFSAKCFRLNPAKPIPINVSKSHIDSSVVMALSILFLQESLRNGSENSLLSNPLHLGINEREQLSKEYPSLANCITLIIGNLGERRNILIRRLKSSNSPLVEVSEIASTIYLIDSFEIRDLLDDELKSAILEYLLKKCARRSVNGSEIEGIGQDRRGDIIGFSMNSAEEWACICSTHLVLSILRDMDVIEKNEGDMTVEKFGKIICRIIPKRWNEKSGAFMPRKGDPASIIPLRYAIKLIRWALKNEIHELELPEDFWEKIKRFIIKCRSRRKDNVFSYIPGGNSNILATRYVLDIHTMIIDLNENVNLQKKIPEILSYEEFQDMEKNLNNVFFRHSISAPKGAI